MKNKTFIWTLTLFVLFINMGIMLFCIITTKHNLLGLKASYSREHYFLVGSITKDVRVLHNEWNTVEESISYACDAYKEQYDSQKIYLQVYKEKECIYSTLPEEIKVDVNTLGDEKDMRTLQVLRQGGRRYMQVCGSLPDEYDAYVLVYYADVTSVVNGWYKMNASLFVAGIFFSVILSFCLSALLEYIFAPLEKISCVSNKIANGEYKEKLDIKGGDEIAEVVQSFNTMSDKIQYQMETLEEYAKEKQRLIDDMAHELRTPLTAIYGYTEHMLKAHLSEEDRYTFLQYILSESRRLKNISENLLEIAVIREDKEIEMLPINVESLFKKIHQTENIKLKEKEIQFTYESEIKEIQGNEDLIESLVMNLLDNAIKACNPRGKIMMKAYPENEKKIIEIQDNGKGMTSEQLLHVKEAFYRVDKARSRKEGGNGLGLALCEQIASKHHAELVIASKPNEGTIIRIIFGN